MNNQTQITPEMLIFIAGIFSLSLIGFTLVVREMVKSLSKDDKEISMEMHDRLVNDKELMDEYELRYGSEINKSENQNN